MGPGARADDRLRRSRVRLRRRHRRGDAGGDPPGHPARDVADVPHRRRVVRRTDVSLGPLHVPRQQQAPPAEGAASTAAGCRSPTGRPGAPSGRDWVLSDGVHLSPAGTDAVTRFIVNNVGQVLAGRTITPPRPNIPRCRTGVALRAGDQLDDVRCLERHLRSLGFDVNVNNYFGAQTVAAVNFLNWARSWRPRRPRRPPCAPCRRCVAAHREPAVVRGRVDAAVRGRRAPGALPPPRPRRTRATSSTDGGRFAAAAPGRRAPLQAGPRTRRRPPGGEGDPPLLGIHRPPCRDLRTARVGDRGPAVWCLPPLPRRTRDPIPLVGDLPPRVAKACATRGAARPSRRRDRRPHVPPRRRGVANPGSSGATRRVPGCAILDLAQHPATLVRHPRGHPVRRGHRVGRRLRRRPLHGLRRRRRRRGDADPRGHGARSPRWPRPPSASASARWCSASLPPSGRAGELGGDRRPHLRWPAAPRHRRRLAGERARAVRHRALLARRARSSASRRRARCSSGCCATTSPTSAATHYASPTRSPNRSRCSSPAAPDRAQGRPDAGHRRPLRGRVERVGAGRHDRRPDGRARRPLRGDRTRSRRRSSAPARPSGSSPTTRPAPTR